MLSRENEPTLFRSFSAATFVALLLAGTPAPAQAQETCTGDNASANYITGEIGGEAVAMHWTSGLVWKRCSEGRSWNAAAQTCEGTPETRRWNEWMDEYMPRSFVGQDAWWGAAGAYTPDPATGPVGVDRLRDGQWRMAYRLELAGLTTGCEDDPKINLEVFPTTSSSVNWSGSPFAGSSNGAWSVGFYSGQVSNDSRVGGLTRLTRLVRGGQPFAALSSPVTGTGAAGSTVSFPPFGLVSESGDGVAWGGLRIAGEGDPQFQVNGGAWVTEAVVRSGDEITVRVQAGVEGSEHEAVLTLRSGQTTPTSANGANGGSEATVVSEASASFRVETLAGGPPAEHVITTSVSAGDGTVNCTPNPVPHGGNATCTATPAAGFNFANWGGACSGSGVCTLSNVTVAQSVSASFTAVPPLTYDVTATASPAVGGNVVCTPSSVPAGEGSTCTATANAGYSFADWGGDCSGTDPVCTLAGIAGDRSVTANFTEYTGTCTGDNASANYIVGEAAGQAVAMHWTSGLVWKRCSEGQSWNAAVQTCEGTTETRRWNEWLDEYMPRSFEGQDAWWGTVGAPPYTPDPAAGPVGVDRLRDGQWRMAYRLELAGLTTGCEDGPKINREVFPATPSWYVWSGSPYVLSSNGAWDVHFNDGYAGFSNRSNGSPVRLVRGGQSFAALSSPVTGTGSAGSTVSFPPFALASESGDGVAWGGLRIAGEGDPQFQVNGGAWVTEAVVRSGDEITVRVQAGAEGSEHEAVLTLRSGQTAPTLANGTNGGQEATVVSEASASFRVEASAAPPAEHAIATSVSAGNGTVSCTPNPVPHGGNATCTATPAAGFNFANWGGACSGSGACTLSNVTVAQSVSASFTAAPPLTYDVTATASPAVGGNVVCTPSSVPAGEGSTCTATANAGYSFTGWSGDCSGTDPVCTLTGIAGDRSVTARFTEYTGTCTGDNASANYIVGEAAGQAVAMHWTSGLVWKRCSEGQSWNAAAQTCEGTPEIRRWNEWMDEYMPRSFEGQDAWWGALSGYTPDPATGPNGVDRLRDGQWRMAYWRELAELRTGCENGPKINREVFPATPSSNVWSGSPYANGSDGAWLVSFNFGLAGTNGRGNVSHVRLVRGGQSFAALSSPETGTGTAGSTVSFPPFALASESGDGVAWGGLRIAGEGNPQFQVNGGAWVTEAVVRSGDEITVRVQAGAQGSEHEAVLTLRSGQTTPTLANGTNGGGEATVVSETSARFRVEPPAAPPAEHAIVTSVSAGSGTVSCTPNPVPHGGNATCTATPAAGFNFASWGGACSGSGACTLSTVTVAQSVSASFTAPPPPPPPVVTYTVTAAASPAAGGTASCTPLIVSSGGASTCTATANPGYRFTGWSGDCSGTEASCTLTDITADRSVMASFTSRTELDLPLPEGLQSGQTLHVVATGGEWYFDEAHTRTHTGASVGEALPAGVTLPHGVVSLRLIGGTPGSSATVVLTYPEALPAGTRYYKYGPTTANPAAHWYEYPHAVISGYTITLTLTDGGAGDSDLSENGVIVDPGGPAQVAGDVAPDVTPIPTLSQWATLLLAGLMGLLAFGRLRRLPHA